MAGDISNSAGTHGVRHRRLGHRANLKVGATVPMRVHSVALFRDPRAQVHDLFQNSFRRLIDKSCRL